MSQKGKLIHIRQSLALSKGIIQKKCLLGRVVYIRNLSDIISTGKRDNIMNIRSYIVTNLAKLCFNALEI